MSIVVTALILIALILAGIDLIRTRAESLTTWAVFLVAFALLITRNFRIG